MIDWDRVRTLKEEIGPEDFDEVLDLFFAEVEEMIGGLPSAADAKSVAHNMHFLKGAALNIGFKDMARKCHEGEAAALQAGDEKLPYDDIISVYQGSKAHLIEAMPQMDSL